MLKTLQNSIEKKRKGESGFTLIELLVVILIIGILAAIVVVAVRGSTSDAKAKACTQNAQNLANAIETFKTTNEDSLPAGAATVDNAVTAINNPTATGVTFAAITGTYSVAELTTALVPDFIKSIPNLADDGVVAVKYTINGATTVGVLCQVPNGKNSGI